MIRIKMNTKAVKFVLQDLSCKCRGRIASIMSPGSQNFHTSSIKKTSGNVNNSEDQGLSELKGRDFISLKNFKKEDLYQFLWTAKDLKFRMKENSEQLGLLQGVNTIGIFHPNSLAQQLSVQLGLSKLGSQLTILQPQEIEEVTGANMKDAAKLLSGMSDLIVLGGYSQEVVNTLANESPTPVISVYSHQQTPLETMAQLLTMLEHFGYLRGLEVAWVGNGNKTMNSLLLGCAKLGMDMRGATPPGYEADPGIMIDSMTIAQKMGASFLMGNEPLKAVYRADAILSGPWCDLGDQADHHKLTNDFTGFQINRKMLKEADADWIFMHSLPRSPQEVTDDIFYGEESMVHTEMENRMWTAMAVMVHLIQPYTPTIPMPKFVRG